MGKEGAWPGKWGEEGTLRGVEDGDRGRRLGDSGFGKGYGSTGALGGMTAERREVGLCGLLWFSTNLGGDVRLKGEGKVLQTAQLWVLPVLILPFPSGWKGQVPLLQCGQGPGQATAASQGPRAALCPATPSFSVDGQKLAPGFINIQRQQSPLMLH